MKPLLFFIFFFLVRLFVQSSALGTVPYLGIFLTDLTMLDAAVKDRLDVSSSLATTSGCGSVFYSHQHDTRVILSLLFQNGYINFDKRRRVSVAKMHHMVQCRVSCFYKHMGMKCRGKYIFSVRRGFYFL